MTSLRTSISGTDRFGKPEFFCVFREVECSTLRADSADHWGRNTRRTGSEGLEKKRNCDAL